MVGEGTRGSITRRYSKIELPILGCKCVCKVRWICVTNGWRRVFPACVEDGVCATVRCRGKGGWKRKSW